MMKTKRAPTSRNIVFAVVVLLMFQFCRPRYFCGHDDMERATSKLCTDLQTVRSQIQLYRTQHNGKLPGSTEGVSFIEAMTLKTNADGSLAINPDGSIPKVGGFGPYLQRIPANPFITDNIIIHHVRWFTRKASRSEAVEIDGNPGGGDYGWNYNATTGAFHADDDAHLSL